MRVRILAEAETEAQKAAEWYETERSGIGFDFLDALSRALRAIERTPQAFAKVKVSRSDREVRRIVMKGFPYRILFEVRSDEVLVIAIAHFRRRPNYWQHRLG